MADPTHMSALFEALLAPKHALVFHRLAAIITPMLAAEPESTIKYIWVSTNLNLSSLHIISFP